MHLLFSHLSSFSQYLFPRAAMTQPHRSGDLTQWKCALSQSRGQMSSPGGNKASAPPNLWGTICPCLFQPLVAPGPPWLASACFVCSFCPLLHSLPPIFVLCLFLLFCLLTKTHVTGFRDCPGNPGWRPVIYLPL